VTTRVSIAAQAKLNLWLRILAKEASGYHSIETLFHRLELHDDVIVSLSPNGERTIHCSEDVGPGADNLAYRAAVLYAEALSWPIGFHIEITKRIPAAGGLGGGSADAAATLVALNAMSPSKLEEAELCALGARLGADVPFLVTRDVAALAWGRGDRLLAVPALPQKHVALAVPGFGISTADAYRTVPARPPRAAEELSAIDVRDWPDVVKRAGNDLSASEAVGRQEAIARAISALRAAGASMAEMTGSGSVVFGVFDFLPDREALELATGCRVTVTRTALNVEGPSRLD
jgi:4-diphosphocytidyl-2-C-methyl-D-erythritol kinase